MRRGGNQAYYNIGQDFIQLSPFESFKAPAAYYATSGHETAHWSRLNREFGRKRFGDDAYAMEELVAEISAAYLCADLGLPPVFTAVAHAQRAVNLLHGWEAVHAGDVAEAA